MRELDTKQIALAVRDLCIEANRLLPPDMKERLQIARQEERSPLGQSVLEDLCENYRQAEALSLPICQDTGMAVVFLELGQEIHLTGKPLEEAVNDGVRMGYQQGLLRCSVVSDPLRRQNTGDNTPAVLHLRLIPGEQVKITVAPKGFGSENMSSLRMFTPAVTREEIIQYVADCVEKAGSNPCPPVVVGVGIGGDFEYCAYLAKKALCRSADQTNPDPFYRQMEEEMLTAINRTGVGSQGFGGTVTALAVNIETYATHIAGLPVAVNMGCHVTRHKSRVL